MGREGERGRGGRGWVRRLGRCLAAVMPGVQVYLKERERERYEEMKDQKWKVFFFIILIFEINSFCFVISSF